MPPRLTRDRAAGTVPLMLVPLAPFARSLRSVSVAATAAVLVAQEPAPDVQPVSPPPATASPGAREAMWYAPTSTDWAKPVLIPWQRTWDDAVVMSQRTRRPILVCVNMDGEIASEHYAGVRYRDPEIAKSYEQYVCVIASVYRHNPRDHDEQGRRIPCPRFGTCTCGEHMAMEPIVFTKFLDGQRIAPRHILVELDGKKAFDVYLAFDTASVLQTIADGMKGRDVAVEPFVRGDRALREKVASPHSVDRMAIEKAFTDGDAATRRSLLEIALTLGEQAPLELLRQAAFGLDPDLAKTARQGLAKSASPGAADAIGEVLGHSLAADEREPLVAALERLAAADPRAQALVRVHRGLAGRSQAVDAETWGKALAGATYAPAPTPDELAARQLQLSQAVAGAPVDPLARIERAEATLAEARQASDAVRVRAVLFADARAEAERAGQLGAPAWRVDAVVALASQALGELPRAYEVAARAVAAMPKDRADATSAALLFLFAEARQEAIVTAHRAKEEWPRQWLTDVHETYAVLAAHPFGTDEQAAHHFDFLQFFGGAVAAGKALDTGLARFPASPLLHERLRARLLREQGVQALAEHYDQALAKDATSPTTTWFAGYAALVRAEHHRRRGGSELANAAYAQAIELFERAAKLDPNTVESCDHYIAMALGGRSRVHFESDALEPAVADLLAAFTRCPAATPVLDGLNLSGADTARMLVAKTRAAGRTDLLAQLEKAMAALDPELLRLPDYERMGPGVQRPRRRSGR
jgi:tetratricopeptide (TPR) repeat protein